MIEIVKGDLIKAGLSNEIDFLLHGCNCYSTMGAGVAKLIRSTWPSAYKVDIEDVRTPAERIGGYSHTIYNRLTVVNLYTQFDYGTNYRRFEYGALKRSLECFVRDFDLSSKHIGLPWIGCNLGGANKKIVLEILEPFTNFGKWFIYSLD
jgi:O-acetyl-ADP-ribose deacetylase (regulator of RNase III)